jgi:hypothetical protein
MTIEIIREGHSARTRGLGDLGQRDLLATVATPDLVAEAEAFLRYVIGYLNSVNTVLRQGETLAYGYWLTKFIETDSYLEAWEYTADATEFVPGVTLTMTYWRDQRRTCERLHATFEPPRPDRLFVISAGVLEGDRDVQGVRYPSPEHMSGWWLTTSRFNGDTASLKTTHAYHITAARPDLAHLIALPYGFRFDLSHTEDVWFDENVAVEKP